MKTIFITVCDRPNWPCIKTCYILVTLVACIHAHTKLPLQWSYDAKIRSSNFRLEAACSKNKDWKRPFYLLIFRRSHHRLAVVIQQSQHIYSTIYFAPPRPHDWLKNSFLVDFRGIEATTIAVARPHDWLKTSFLSQLQRLKLQSSGSEHNPWIFHGNYATHA
jgi:hypothetical protein